MATLTFPGPTFTVQLVSSSSGSSGGSGTTSSGGGTLNIGAINLAWGQQVGGVGTYLTGTVAINGAPGTVFNLVGKVLINGIQREGFFNGNLVMPSGGSMIVNVTTQGPVTTELAGYQASAQFQCWTPNGGSLSGVATEGTYTVPVAVSEGPVSPVLQP